MDSDITVAQNEELSNDKALEGDKEEFVHLKFMPQWRNRSIKRIKNLKPQKIFSRLPVILAQMKAGNNLSKFN